MNIQYVQKWRCQNLLLINTTSQNGLKVAKAGPYGHDG